MPLVQRQADSGKITVSASEPATPLKGDLWYDTSNNELFSYNGSAFVSTGHAANETQTLTNKTIALGSNTITGTLAQISTACTNDNIPGLGAGNTFTGEQTFTGKINQTNKDQSTYEYFNALTTNTTSHFVEWFVGQALDDNRWLLTDSGSSVMSNTIDGGFQVLTGAGSFAASGLEMNDIDMFDFNQSWMIFTIIVNNVKAEVDSIAVGFSETGRFDGAGNNAAVLRSGAALTNFELRTINGAGAQTNTDTGETIDENLHTWKIETLSSSVVISLDGVVVGTSSTNLPAGKMQPIIGLRKITGGGGTIISLNVRYVEVKNT